MSQLREIIKGLEIFEKHGGDYLYAAHDEIFAYHSKEQLLSDEEINTLEVNGWFRGGDSCNGSSCDWNSELGHTTHSRDCTGWSRYV